MKNFVLTGTYNSKNKGDAAMQICTAEAIRELFPKSRIYLNTPFPIIDGNFYNDNDINIVPSSRRRIIYGSLQVIRALLFRVTKFGGNEEIKCFSNADAVFDLSGDMQTESYGIHVTFSHFLPLLLSLALKRPIILCAQSVGPFRWTVWLAKIILSKVDLITVRDEISYNYLKNKRLGKAVRLTGDMAFLLKAAGKDKIDAIMQAAKIPIDERPLLGVSVSGLIAQHYRKHNPNATLVTFEDLMANELDRLIERFSINVVFVPHVTGPTLIKDDRIAASKVIKRLQHAERAYNLRDDLHPEEIKGVISRLWLQIGARMHANIAALTSCVPVSAIAYSHKTPGIMKQFGLEKCTIEISEFKSGDLVNAISFLAENRDEVVSRLEVVNQKLMERAKTNIHLASKHLKLR